MTIRSRLESLLSPSRVAWFGGDGMAPALNYMRANEFKGDVVAVNPKRADIGDTPCVPSVTELPWIPDLAVLIIPKGAVLDTVPQLVDIGCRAAICISSGFREIDGGEDLEASLVKSAGDMPLVGPNCPGIANFLDGNVFMMNHFGDHRPEAGIAVISNGGAYLSDLGCADRSQPIAYLIGLGNQAMVGIPDMLDLVLDDPRVTAINLYFEGLNDVTGLSQCAAKAAQRKIPIVVIKGGRSETGKRAAKSHTASMAGDAEIASALFKRFGWIEVSTPSEAIETLKMLSFTPIPSGVKTGFITSSGSYAVLGGDVAEKVGLEIAPPSETHAAALDAALPAYVGPANPLDISDAHGWPREDQLPIYRAFAANDYDIFAQVMCYPPEDGWDMSTWDVTTSALAEAARGQPVAFVNTLADALPCKARNLMIANGMAPLQGMEDGLRAIAHAARYGCIRDSLEPDSMLLPAVPMFADDGVLLGEQAAKLLLQDDGIDVPKQWVIDDLSALPEISCVTVLKAIVPGLIHKTEAGAVMLNILPEELPSRIKTMSAQLNADGYQVDGYLIEEMITDPIAELLVGLRRVEGVGAVLTMATGGVAVELLSDKALVILPATQAAIKKSLLGLRLSPLFTGYRGRPAADLDSVLDAIGRLCQFFLNDPGRLELEINPLLLTPTRAVVVDTVFNHRYKG